MRCSGGLRSYTLAGTLSVDFGYVEDQRREGCVHGPSTLFKRFRGGLAHKTPTNCGTSGTPTFNFQQIPGLS